MALYLPPSLTSPVANGGPFNVAAAWSIFHAGGPFHRLVGLLSGGFASSPMTKSERLAACEDFQFMPRSIAGLGPEAMEREPRASIGPARKQPEVLGRAKLRLRFSPSEEARTLPTKRIKAVPCLPRKASMTPGTSWLNRGPGIVSRALISADKTNASITFGQRCHYLLCGGPSFPFF
jgi:hypothetical protein